MDGVVHIEEETFDLLLNWVNLIEASLNVAHVLSPFKFDVDGEDALLVDELPDDFRVGDNVCFGPKLKVDPHQQIVKF